MYDFRVSKGWSLKQKSQFWGANSHFGSCWSVEQGRGGGAWMAVTPSPSGEAWA